MLVSHFARVHLSSQPSCTSCQLLAANVLARTRLIPHNELHTETYIHAHARRSCAQHFCAACRTVLRGRVGQHYIGARACKQHG